MPKRRNWQTRNGKLLTGKVGLVEKPRKIAIAEVERSGVSRPNGQFNGVDFHKNPAFLVVAAISLGLQISGWIGFVPGALRGHSDFRAFYTAGYMVRTGHGRELYDYEAEKRFEDRLASPEAVAMSFIHAPYEALVYVPFSALSYRSAYACFLVFNIALLALAVRISELPVIVPLSFLPIPIALMQGQGTIFTLLALTVAGRFFSVRRDFLAGTVLALTMFKLQLALPVVAVLAAWRYWRLLFGFACSTAGCAVLSIAICGMHGIRGFFGRLTSLSAGLSQSRWQLMVKPGDMPNLRGLLHAAAANQIQILIVSALLFACTVGFLRENFRDIRFAGAVTFAALVSYHMLIYDLGIVLAAFAFWRSSKISSQLEGYLFLGIFAAVDLAVFFPGRFYVAALPLLAFHITLMTSRAAQRVLH